MSNYAHRQIQRRIYQGLFFILFIVAPIFDWLRFDLYLGQLIVFGSPWELGIDELIAARGVADQALNRQAVVNLLLRVFLPLLLLVLVVAWVAWRYGRLYCGWLCPHYSVVETINHIMRRTIGKFSLWDRHRLPNISVKGEPFTQHKFYWLVLLVAVLGFAFLWAVVLLTYLLAPEVVYGNLWHGELSRNQALFITVATGLLCIEFLFARHLFCRFACAVGVFQSFLWMANKKAMLVSFDRSRAAQCQDCNDACDHACPMRLKPRTIKRSMFTCTQCGKCLQACENVQQASAEQPIIRWKSGVEVLKETQR